MFLPDNYFTLNILSRFFFHTRDTLFSYSVSINLFATTLFLFKGLHVLNKSFPAFFSFPSILEVHFLHIDRGPPVPTTDALDYLTAVVQLILEYNF